MIPVIKILLIFSIYYFLLVYATDVTNITNLFEQLICYESEGKVKYLNECQRLLSEEPCDLPNHWLVLGKDGVPICKNRDCDPGFILYENKCVDVEKHTCNEGMILYAKLTGEGRCDCTEKLIYHQETDSCYDIYDQGPCNDKSILRKNENGTLECVNNPCVNEKLILNEIDGECYKKQFLGECGSIEFKDGIASCQVLFANFVYERETEYICREGTKLSFYNECEGTFYSFIGQKESEPDKITGRCKSGFIKTKKGTCQKSSGIF